MPYTYTISAAIAASTQEIYDAWLDSLGHSEMTGGKASMSDEIGAEFSAWDGYITGRNIELIPGERIVQSWRTTQFYDEHEDSIITLTLEQVEDGTLLTLVHSNVPDEQTSYERGGWQEYYFAPMTQYFADIKQAGASGASEEAIARTKRKPAVARGKSKPAAPRAKTAAGKKKSKRSIAAKAKPKRVTTSKSKPARRKRRV